MTEENEWEFRAFFDKIIQLPFSMPLSSYNISKYLQSLLIDVQYFEEKELKNEETLEKITQIVNLSVGTNPRSLKRLANSVSLIEIIRGEQKITSDERVIEFALICIQIAYPIIYNLIQKESNFISWDAQFVYGVLKNRKIDEKDLELLKESEEFDEEWEQNLWRICQINSFLKARAFLLSKLLNFIKDNTPKSEDEEMGDTLNRLLSMSSVTSVSAEGIAMSSLKEKYKKTIFENWDTYSNILKEKNINSNVIIKTKEIIDEIKASINDNRMEIKYTPTMISLRNKSAKGRKKIFAYIILTKKYITIGLTANENLKIKYPNEKVDSFNDICFKINQDNSFEYKKYLSDIIENFNLLSE